MHRHRGTKERRTCKFVTGDLIHVTRLFTRNDSYHLILHTLIKIKNSIYISFLRCHLILREAFVKFRLRESLEPYSFPIWIHLQQLFSSKTKETDRPCQARRLALQMLMLHQKLRQANPLLHFHILPDHGPHLCWLQWSELSAHEGHSSLSASNNPVQQLWWVISLPLLLLANANNAAWHRLSAATEKETTWIIF